ncbi:MAG TPA: prolyl oligopeptidase family serine peptidase [Thermoanaerobaculia bacterium]|nr:prolyl oligopeptidase family serine peptidase [Thermoanaerobaculia bacterium]
MRRLLIPLFVLLSAAAAQAQLKLDIDTIMRGPQLVGYAPRDVRWSRDGKSVYFAWKQRDEPTEENEYSTYVVGRDGKGLRKLTDEEAKDAPPARGDFSRDKSRVVFSDRGDLFLFEKNKRRALTHTIGNESQPRFTKDEKHVAFVRDNNLFVLSLVDGSTTQITNIVGADEKGPNVSLFEDENKDRTASQKWVSEEAKKLSDVLTRREAERKEDDAERKKEIAIAPLKLKKGESVQDLRLTPDEQFVLAFIGGDPSTGKRAVVPSYVTESGYTTDLPARRKVGDSEPATRLASISVKDGKVTWLEHGLKQKIEKTETAEKTEATENKSGTKTEVEEDRAVDIDPVFFSDDGNAAVLPIRAADNKDRWLMAFDPATGKTRVLHHEHDDAWVHWFDDDAIGFVPGSQTVWFISEHTGWMHLYALDYKGGTPRAITSGEYEVANVRVSDDAKNFFFTASKDSLHELQLYRAPVGGGAITRLTKEAGWHDAELSPDGLVLADIYSYTNKPHELYVNGVRVTDAAAPEFFTYPWQDAPIVSVPARDGAKVPARIYKPANWNGGPAVIFVHGAGYLQNVHRGWSNYFREYMFHHILMERGYLVLDLDYRASSGYGRNWRTAIYRHMGGVDLDDHVDAAKWLASEQRADPKRIGIYGGSYGGFITLMAMFTAPDVFAAGAALRPVTDWAHYNHGYTANILNTPQKDPVAYRQSSPMYFAEGLKGHLLICHGVIDVNVHFQDTVRLAQRLIELRKENWEVAMFPLEDHSFVEPTSWADEYKRILKLFDTTLR